MSSSFYPYLPTAPIRTFVTADTGLPIYTEFAGAVAAGQTITGAARVLSDQKHGVMVQIDGLSEPYDVEAVVLSHVVAAFVPPQAEFSLTPVTANGKTSWFASPLVRTWAGIEDYRVTVKFRQARAAVTVRSQQYAF